MDHDQRAILRKTIQAALARKLKSHEYIQSYNAVYKYCTQRTNTFEILGEKMYLILYAEIDTYTKGLTFTSMKEFINEAIRYESAVESVCGVFKYLTRFYIRCNLDLRMSNVLPLKKMMYSLFYINFAHNVEDVLMHSLDSTVIKFYYKLLLYSDALRRFEEVKKIYADSIVFDGDAECRVAKLEKYLNEIRNVFCGKSVEDVIGKVRDRIGDVNDILEYLCLQIRCCARINCDFIDALRIHEQLFMMAITSVLDHGLIEGTNRDRKDDTSLNNKEQDVKTSSSAEKVNGGGDYLEPEVDTCESDAQVQSDTSNEITQNDGKASRIVLGKRLIDDDLSWRKRFLDDKAQHLKEYFILVDRFIYCSELNEMYFRSEKYQKILKNAFLKRVKDKSKVHNAIVLLIDWRVKQKIVQWTDEHECIKIIKKEFEIKKWDTLIDLLEIFGDDLHELIHVDVLRRVLFDENTLERERALVTRMEERIKYFGKTRLALTDFLLNIHSVGGILNLTGCNMSSGAHGNGWMGQGNEIDLNSPNTLTIPGINVRCFTKYFWPIKATRSGLNNRLEEVMEKVFHYCRDKGYRVEFNHYYSEVKLKINEHIVTCDAALASLILDVYDHKQIHLDENKAGIDRLVNEGIINRRDADNGNILGVLELNDNLFSDMNLFNPELKVPVSSGCSGHCLANANIEVMKCKIIKIMKRTKKMDLVDLQNQMKDNIDEVLSWLIKYNYVKQVNDTLEYVP